ncbi:hypothetical protein BYT27DRAFT_7186401, partial [Phlegmacium glaucopus]
MQQLLNPGLHLPPSRGTFSRTGSFGIRPSFPLIPLLRPVHWGQIVPTVQVVQQARGNHNDKHLTRHLPFRIHFL